MKIAIVSLDNSNKIKSGGKHIHQMLLEKGLQSKGHEVYNIFPRRTLQYIMGRLILSFLKKLSLISSARVFSWTLYSYQKSLTRQLTRLDIELDKILTQDPVSAVAAYLALPEEESKIYMTLHGYLSLESVNYGKYSSKEKKDVIAKAKAYEEQSLSMTNQVISVDTRIKNYLKNEFGYKKDVYVLKNAVNPDVFNKLNKDEKHMMREKLGIPHNKKVILVPRRLVKKNGVHVALQAMKSLQKNADDYYMLIMGAGPEDNHLRELKNQLDLTENHLKFLGNQPHQAAIKYYDLAEIILVPSIISDGIEEATSLSMLEGMAAKKVVITSNIGGMKEVIKDGENGFLFEQGNVDELVQVLSTLRNTSEEVIKLIVEQAYRDVCERHHYLRHTEMYLSLKDLEDKCINEKV